MEVDSSVNHVVAEKLWNMLRVAFFMLRKGGMLKRKMMLDIHVMMKRGKVLGKTFVSLMFHHSHSKSHHYGGFGIKEYEFSCSNSPAPPSLAFQIAKGKKHHYFLPIPRIPCIQPHTTEEDDCHSNVIVVSQSEYFTKNNLDLSDLPVADQSRPLSPFCAQPSNFSEEEEKYQVDRKAEEFISKFYDQMRLQRQISFVQYNEMLARGAT